MTDLDRALDPSSREPGPGWGEGQPFVHEPLPPPVSSEATKAAFAAFIAEHFDRAMILARRTLRSARRGRRKCWVPPHDHEDVVHDALEMMCRDPRGGSPEEWCYQLCRAVRLQVLGRYRDHLRWKAQIPFVLRHIELHTPPTSAAPGEVLELRDELSKIQRIIDIELSPERSGVARRYFLENEPMAEIAASLGVSVDTIKTRVKLARKDIEAAIARDEAKERPALGLIAFLLFLFNRTVAFFRRGNGRGREARPAQHAPGNDRRRNAGTFAAAVLSLSLLATCAATHAGIQRFAAPEVVHISTAAIAVPAAPLHDRPPPSAETSAPSAPSVDTAGKAPAPSARRPRAAPPGLPRGRAPAAKSSAHPARPTLTEPMPPLLSKARDAIQQGRFSEAAEWLRAYEVNHPDPSADPLHRDLRVELDLRSLDKAPLIR